MIQYFTSNNQYRIDFNLNVKDILKPFKQEVLDEIYRLYRLYGNMPVLYSGGMDSTFIVRSLLELGIKPSTLTISFSKDHSDEECEMIKQKCKKFGIDRPEFFYIDEAGFFNHIDYLIDINKPLPMLHGYFMDYLLTTFRYQKFFTGMSCEYKCLNGVVKMPPGPFMVMQNNPGQLYGFTTDKTFLSYFKHKLFIDNYKKIKEPPITIRDMVHIRDLIYMDCYPDITKQEKSDVQDWKEYIRKPFLEKYAPAIKQKFPWVFDVKPCLLKADFLVEL